MAVDLSAGAYAFHDLLAQIAALGETDGVHLLGFLGEVAFGDVLTVARSPVFDPYRTGRLGVSFGDAGGGNSLDQRGTLGYGKKHAKAQRTSGGRTRDETILPVGNVIIDGGSRQAKRFNRFL